MSTFAGLVASDSQLYSEVQWNQFLRREEEIKNQRLCEQYYRKMEEYDQQTDDDFDGIDYPEDEEGEEGEEGWSDDEVEDVAEEPQV